MGAYGSGTYGAGLYGVGEAGVPPIPAVSRWLFVVCNLTGVPIGEPIATSRSLTVGVSRTGTATFRVRAGSHLWDEIAAGDTTLKVYDAGGALRFFGDVVSDELVASGQGGTIAVQAADLSARLAERYIGKDATGVGVTYTTTDSGAIARAALAAVNAEQATGIRAGTTGAFVPRTVTYLWKKALDVLAELGAIEGSYEWTLRYEDGTPPTVYLDLAAQTGSNRAADVFLEYGTGRNNAAAYSRVRTRPSATRVYVIGAAPTTAVGVAYDSGAEASWRIEDVLNVGDIADEALLDALAAQHVAVRHVPRRIVNMTPFAATAPRYGIDWFLGDYITARAVIEDTVDTDGAARVWGATISIDELGNERANLVLEPT